MGIISGKDCIALGVTGPVLRASGVKWDIRKALPYANYKNFDFEIPTGQNGDTYDRYLVRMVEMRQSLRIIEQAVDGIPEGPIMAKVPKVMKPPVGEIYHSIEAPKGELGYFIVSDGSTQPYRMRVRPPSFREPSGARCDVPRPAGGRRYRRDRHARHCSRRGGPLMHRLIDYIQSYLGSNQTPGGAGNIFWATVYILLVFGGLSVAVICMNWLERKILAHMQVRLGPMRVGPHGLLQPIADAIKLLLKEDIIPAEADKIVFWVAPFIVVLAAFTVFVVVPFGPTHAITDMNIGILFMLGVSSLSVLGIVTAGWASNSHYPLIGALRSSAQMVSYEVAMGLAVVSVIMMTSLAVATVSRARVTRHAQHDRHRAGAAGAGRMVHLQVFPARPDRIRHFCHRHGRGDQPRTLRSARSGVGTDRGFPYRVQRLSLVVVLSGRIFRDDRGFVDRSHAMAGGMAASVPEPAAAVSTLGFGSFSLFPGITFLFARGACASTTCAACPSILCSRFKPWAWQDSARCSA